MLHDPIPASSGQYLALELKRIVEDFAPGTELALLWIPSHKDFEEHDRANLAAREAASSDIEGFNLKTSLSLLLESSKSFFADQIQLPTIDNRPHFSTPPDLIWKALANLEKGRASIIFQLCSGHIALNTYLFCFCSDNTVKSNKCETCKSPKTTEHYLIHCRRFNYQRAKFRKALKKLKPKVTTNVFDSSAMLDNPALFPLLSDYVLSTKRYPHFRIYLDEPD